MGVKNLIKDAFCINSKLNYEMYRLLGNNADRMTEIVSQLGEVDSIADIEPIREFKRSIDCGREVFYTTDANRSNTLIYGIWESMFGWTKDDWPSYMTPAVEHGLIFFDAIFTDTRYTARASCVTMSPFRRRIIQKYKRVPVFCVGPYIGYASPYYGDALRKKKKGEFGKTLCVFPTHSTNDTGLTRDEEQFVRSVGNMAKGFDTVLVNAFWWNINDPLIFALEAEGYRIVSAGFRDDINFLSRLRSIIELSDLTIGDGVGTHIGYSLSLGVPYNIISGNPESVISSKDERARLDVTMGLSELHASFSRGGGIREDQLKLCEKYWGFSKVKTKQQLAAIGKLTHEIMEESRGWSKLIWGTSEKVLSRLSSNHDDEGLLLLAEAMGFCDDASEV